MPPCPGCDAPLDETPRERLERRGAASLSDAELLALVLRPAPEGEAVEHTRALLESCGGLPGLLTDRIRRHRHPCIGPARLATLSAAIELARRLARTRIPRRQILNAPGAVAAYLAMRYGNADQEILGALYCGARHRLLGDVELYRGSLDHASVEPRAILKEALLLSAKSFVLFHTHPSGEPTPSAEDIAFTRRLADAGELVGIRLLDHLIVTHDGRWVALSHSFKW